MQPCLEVSHAVSLPECTGRTVIDAGAAAGMLDLQPPSADHLGGLFACVPQPHMPGTDWLHLGPRHETPSGNTDSSPAQQRSKCSRRSGKSAAAACCSQQRVMRVSCADLAALRQLSGLTQLRLGWRAVDHAGPPTALATSAAGSRVGADGRAA